jgi:hypothetical protein
MAPVWLDKQVCSEEEMLKRKITANEGLGEDDRATPAPRRFTITFTTANIADTPLYVEPNGHKSLLGPGTKAMVHVVACATTGSCHQFDVCGRTGRIYVHDQDTGRVATVHGIPDPEPFGAGKTAVVSLDPELLPLLGAGITGAIISHDGQETGSEWFLQEVNIETGLQHPTGAFVFNQWIVGNDKVPRREKGAAVSALHSRLPARVPMRLPA